MSQDSILKISILLLTLSSAGLLGWALIPVITHRYGKLSEQRAARASRSLDEMFIWIGHNRLMLIFGLAPIVLGVALFILFNNLVLLLAGLVFGFILPMTIINMLEKRRKKKFYSQLPDTLTSLTQSLKAGLSFIQALEIVAEELPPPISQEFALMVKEYKMGVPLPESFERLNKKMESDDLNLITTAILIAFETGGNLTDIFTHLNENIRQKNRVMEQLKTLTTQATLQAKILTGLPVMFAILIFKMNPTFFSQMISTNVGRFLLVWCVISEIIGGFILNRLSHLEV
jgi:tight adherence protein B